MGMSVHGNEVRDLFIHHFVAGGESQQSKDGGRQTLPKTSHSIFHISNKLIPPKYQHLGIALGPDSP